MDNCIRISKNLKATYLCKIDNEAVVINCESVEVLYIMWGIDIVQETDTHYLVQLPEGWSYTEFVDKENPGYRILDDKGRVRICGTETCTHFFHRYYNRLLPMHACKHFDFGDLDCSNLKPSDWIEFIYEPSGKIVEIIRIIENDGSKIKYGKLRVARSDTSLYINEYYPDIFYLNAYWD